MSYKTYDLPDFDENKPLTKSLLTIYYKEIKLHGRKNPEFYHMLERDLMKVYIHQIAENMLDDKQIYDFAIIFRKIHKVDYPRWFA
jgi:hypothetical protein